MKKMTIGMLAALLVLSFAGSVFAGPAYGYGYGCGANYSQNSESLTTGQKAQIDTWRQERLEQRKQVLERQVEWGWITQAQADQQISWLERQADDNERVRPMGRDGYYGHRGGGCGGGGCRGGW